LANTELSGFLGYWLPRVESEMRELLTKDEPSVAAHYQMMCYHLGWVDEHFRPAYTLGGKRLRPLLCLLACAEVGGDPIQAMPAAVAIELLHNFSLIHDDIEDGDETRRHRPTVWKVWGVPQAVNAGDAMYTLAYTALQRLPHLGVSAETTLQVFDLFTRTCLALTEGQYLDMRFEGCDTVTEAEYLRMIQGKTAALVGASAAIGGLVGGASASASAALFRFGEAVGLAFQMQDDLLGILGDPEVTGKPAGNDLLRRKKSLPVIHTLNHALVGEQFAALLAAPADDRYLERALALMEQAGAREYVEAEIRRQHDAGLTSIHEALGDRAATSALLALAEGLLHRQA
jgi:geranylgeranyl diphosphate synthase type I